MKKHNSFSAIPILIALITVSGCQLSDEEKDKLNDAQVDLEQIADQIIITYPANNATITDSIITVRADIPSAAEAQEVTLFVDGVEVAKDVDGAPWEISWPSYYWADGGQHTLLLKTVTGGGNEVRNNQQHQVIVSPEANKALTFQAGIDGLKLKDKDSLLVGFSTFPGATGYEVIYSGGGQVKEIDSTEKGAQISGLGVGEYSLRYRAIREYSGLTTLTGPWSEPAIFEVLPPDLPTINKPVISSSQAGYGIEVSWEDIGEGSSYTAYLSDVDSDITSSHNLGDATSLILSNLETGSYEFQLKRTNALGQDSLLSDPMEINLGIFHKRFGGTGSDRAKFIKTTQSGQYLVLASTTSRGDSSGDDWIFLLDEQGEMLWEYLYTHPGTTQINKLFELENGNIIGFGSTGTYPNLNGLIVLISSNGEKLWDKEYINPNYNRLRVNGVTEQEGITYIISQGETCTTEGSLTTCQIEAPLLETINMETGEIVSSVQIEDLNDAIWGRVSSLSTTSSGKFLLSFSVKKPDCVDLFECGGAGMAIVNDLGEMESEWNSLHEFSFLNGRFAGESPSGGFVLSGQPGGGIGVPIALFDSNAAHTGTYNYLDGYSNQREFIAFNDNGLMYQLVGKSSFDWPILISRDSNGTAQEEKIFSELKRDYSYPAALDSATDGGLVLLFTEHQSGSNNPDVVVIKIGSLEP